MQITLMWLPCALFTVCLSVCLLWIHTNIAFHFNDRVCFSFAQLNSIKLHSFLPQSTPTSIFECFQGPPCSLTVNKSRPLMMFQGHKVYLFISLSLGKRADGLGQSASAPHTHTCRRTHARHIRKLRLLGDRGAMHISGPALRGTLPARRRGERNPLIMIQQMTGRSRSGPSFFLC